MLAEMQRTKLNTKVSGSDELSAGFAFKWALGPLAWNPAILLFADIAGYLFQPLAETSPQKSNKLIFFF